MEKLTIAVVGAGRFYETMHGPVIENQERIGTRILCEKDPDRAEYILKKFSYDRAYTDLDELLEKEQLDAIYILTPHSITSKLAIKMQKAGIPAFLEKPIATNIEEAKEIEKAWIKYKIPHFVAFNRRHNPLTREIQEYIKDKSGLSHVSVEFFRNDRKAPTRVMGSGIHILDALRSLVGDVKTVHTIKSSTEYFDKKPIAFSSLLTFDSGESGVFNYVCRAGENHERYSLFFENETIIIELTNPGGIEDPKTLKIYKNLELVKDVDFKRDLPEEKQTSSYFNGIVDEHKFFLDCLENKTDMKTDIVDSIKTINLASAIFDCYSGAMSDYNK